MEPGVLTDGSSPQARGTHEPRAQRVHHERFIPAGAGNTIDVRIDGLAASVHPRRRGEHFLSDQISRPGVGSSPQARGTRSGRFLRG